MIKDFYNKRPVAALDFFAPFGKCLLCAGDSRLFIRLSVDP